MVVDVVLRHGRESAVESEENKRVLTDVERRRRWGLGWTNFFDDKGLVL